MAILVNISICSIITIYTDDTGFPVLSGLSDPLINWMNKHITNRWFWIILFVSMSLGGLTAIIAALLPAYDALEALGANLIDHMMK